MKKLLGIFMALILMLSLFGCSTQPTQDAPSEETQTEQEAAPAAEEKLELMFVSPKTDDPIWLVAKEGFEAAAEDFGFEAIWTGAPDHTVEGTVQSLEATVASQPDGIVVVPLAPPAFTSTLETAAENEIPVVSLILKPEREDLRNTWIGADFTKAGTDAITAIHEKLGTDDINLAFVYSNLDVDIQIEQSDAAESYLATLNNSSSIVTKIADNADPSEAYRMVKDALTANPEINAIQSAESGGTPGVGQALRELGLQDTVVAVCSDDTDINLDTIRNGDIYGATAQDFWGMGYLAGQYLYMINHDMEVPSEVDTGVILVTKENIDTYAEDRSKTHEQWRIDSQEIVSQANG